MKVQEHTNILNQRQGTALLQETAGFSSLPSIVLAEVASKLVKLTFPKGEVIVREGEKGEKLFIVADGKAEMTVSKASDHVPIALLTKGETFGASCLLEPDHVQTGTVTALTQLECFALDDADFDALTSLHPEFKNFFEQFERDITEAKFLKLATPFLHLPAEKAEHLARSIERRDCKKGEVLFHCGEKAEACYLVIKGKMELILPAAEGKAEKRLGSFGPGSLFGEAALLYSDSLRCETAVAAEDTELLVMHRIDLLQVIKEEKETFSQVSQLMQFRARPRQVEGVEIYERQTSSGDAYYILKNPVNFTYYRLSPEGLFIWKQLDGHSSVRDLALAFFKEYKQFSPGVIADILAGLTASGFLQTKQLHQDVERSGKGHIALPQRVMLLAARILQWKITIKKVDGVLERMYQNGVWIAFTKPAQMLFALITVSGLAIGLMAHDQIVSTFSSILPDQLLWLLPIAILAIVLHEAGHAFAVKATGHQVAGVGLGWYWISPIAFVDTSDTWLGTRKDRMTVSFAGPYMNLITAGIAMILVTVLPEGSFGTGCLLFALFSYAIVLFNLNPLLQYDGYYLLMDWQDYPNLRAHSVKWLRENWKIFFINRSSPQSSKAAKLYIVFSIVYNVLLSLLLFVAYNVYAKTAVSKWLSPIATEIVGWAISFLVLLITFIALTRKSKKH